MPKPFKLIEINMSQLSTHEQERVSAEPDSDPFEILNAKIDNLSELLGCSYAQAEHVLFDRLGQYAGE